MTRPIIARVVTVADLEEFAELLPATCDIACDPATDSYRVAAVGEDGELVPLEEQ